MARAIRKLIKNDINDWPKMIGQKSNHNNILDRPSIKNSVKSSTFLELHVGVALSFTVQLLPAFHYQSQTNVWIREFAINF